MNMFLLQNKTLWYCIGVSADINIGIYSGVCLGVVVWVRLIAFNHTDLYVLYAVGKW